MDTNLQSPTANQRVPSSSRVPMLLGQQPFLYGRTQNYPDYHYNVDFLFSDSLLHILYLKRITHIKHQVLR